MQPHPPALLRTGSPAGRTALGNSRSFLPLRSKWPPSEEGKRCWRPKDLWELWIFMSDLRHMRHERKAQLESAPDLAPLSFATAERLNDPATGYDEKAAPAIFAKPRPVARIMHQQIIYQSRALLLPCSRVAFEQREGLSQKGLLEHLQMSHCIQTFTTLHLKSLQDQGSCDQSLSAAQMSGGKRGQKATC